MAATRPTALPTHDPLCRLADPMREGSCECSTIRRVRASERGHLVGQVDAATVSATRMLLERLRARIDLALAALADVAAADRRTTPPGVEGGDRDDP